MPDHKLNNTDDITSRIIQSVTSLVILSVKIPCHYIICLFESHCNTLHHSLGIYRENLSVDIFTDIFYHRVNYIGNVLCKSYTSLYCLTFFFHSLFSHCNSLGIYRGNFSIGVYQWIQGWEILSVKVITIYQWNFSVGISFCICQCSSSLYSPMNFMSKLIESWCQLNLALCHRFWFSHQAIWILLDGSIYIRKSFTL